MNNNFIKLQMIDQLINQSNFVFYSFLERSRALNKINTQMHLQFFLSLPGTFPLVLTKPIFISL